MTNLSLLNHRILFLSEPISSEIANDIITKLLLLDADDHQSQIDLYINSPGGSVLDALAIIDTMHCIQAPVSTICIGKASSMAAWILAAGNKGKRLAAPNAEILIHQAASSFAGQTSDIQIYTKRLIQLQERLIDMLSKWTGQNKAKIKKDMEHEFFMDAYQAKEYGIIDNVLEIFK